MTHISPPPQSRERLESDRAFDGPIDTKAGMDLQSNQHDAEAQTQVSFFQSIFGFRLLYDTKTAETKSDKLGVFRGTDTNAGGKGSIKSKRSNRIKRSSKSTYAIAPRAPMKLSQKFLHTGPRLLYQIQRVSTESRPVPVLDVLHPLSNIIPRVAKGFPCLFNGRSEMGPSDVLICQSENYETESTGAHKRRDYFSKRVPIAAIHDLDVAEGDIEAEVCFRNGSVWHARALGKNTFEFRNIQQDAEKEIIARWVYRKPSKKATSSIQSNTDLDQNLIFSIVEPERRQHPILATLSRNVLVVSDFYRAINTDSQSVADDSDSQTSQLSQDRPYIAIPEEIKTLAQITSVWVTLRMGWCANFTYPEEGSKSCLCTRACSSRSRGSTVDVTETRFDPGKSHRLDSVRTANSSMELDLKDVHAELSSKDDASISNKSSWKLWKKQKSREIQ